MSDRITLAHGGGGRRSAQLIETEIVGRFGNPALADLPDAATLEAIPGRLVFSTDSFVVSPRFFPGGDIGKLAVYGTVNDLLVGGGLPLYLSLGLIIEEGLPLSELRRILDSVQSAAAECGVAIATGDTKVVPRGQADGIYINTSGIGRARTEFQLAAGRIVPGDRVLVSGTLGDHGFAVMAVRHGIGGELVSDCGSLRRLCDLAAEFGEAVKFMRDPTRGGLAAVSNEIVGGRDFGMELTETDIPFAPPVAMLAEIMGIDPLQAASEGRLLAVASPAAAEALLKKFRALPEGRNAALIGTVNSEAGKVTKKTAGGVRRLLELPAGELLPRIC